MPKIIERQKRLIYPIASLFQPRKEFMKPDISNASRQNAVSEHTPPFNSELVLIDELSQLLLNPNITAVPVSYWKPGLDYDTVDVFASTIEFFDCHEGPLPNTTLPPERDVIFYIDKVLESERRLTVIDQLKILLQISGGNIIGAGNVGFLGSRIMARGWDSRAYPNIKVTADMIRNASKHLAPFETDAGIKTDSPGDTYYFWTNFFATTTYRSLGGIDSKAFDGLFGVGTPLMRFVRKNIVKQPTVSRSDEASILGRNLGIAAVEMIRVNNTAENKESDDFCLESLPFQITAR